MIVLQIMVVVNGREILIVEGGGFNRMDMRFLKQLWEIRTLRVKWRGLETESRTTLPGHEGA